MERKIKVVGKAQNGVALGIIKAYVTIYPQTTLADLRKIFPNEIAPDKGVEELFLPLAEAEKRNQKSNTSLYFAKEERPILLSDGTKVVLSQIWTANSLKNLTNVAAGFGIEAVVDKDTDKDVKKLGYALEYLNGWKPAAPKKGCLGMLAFLFMVGGGTLWGLIEFIK